MTTTIDTLHRLNRASLYGGTMAEAAETLRTIPLPKRLPVYLAHLPIARRETFAAGNMTGGLFSYWSRGDGILPSDWRETFRRDTADGQAYIVYSYQTPIAWERSDGLRVIPPVSYSVSTSRHQREVRSAWGMTWGRAYGHPTRSMTSL